MSYSFHIEPTSRCTLECPLCDRTKFYERFKFRNLHNINIKHLHNFLKPYTGSQITLCGNNGDPIYHKEFLELIKMLKSLDCVLMIVTNGSFKTRKWWQELKILLSEKDTVKFSVDGLEDTNHLYRINADWESIQTGMQVMNNEKNCKTAWKFIVFKHNQHQIEEARARSKAMGFDEFELEKSDRWWQKDLMPDEDYVSGAYIHQEDAITNTNNEKKVILPKCIAKDSPRNYLYIDSEGDFYPCCWQGLDSFKYKGIFSPKNKKFNIREYTLNDILENSEVSKFFETTKLYEKSDLCCKIYCGQNK
jgi:wyosine [tRNA(Phe)-imidazoG37] synthetase (radical SAM superfamily)